MALQPKSPAAPPYGHDSNEGKSTTESTGAKTSCPAVTKAGLWDESMRAVLEPVRRGAGVVRCYSKPFDHIIVCSN